MDSPSEPARTRRSRAIASALKAFVYSLVILIGSLALIEGLVALTQEAKPKPAFVEFGHSTRYRQYGLSNGMLEELGLPRGRGLQSVDLIGIGEHREGVVVSTELTCWMRFEDHLELHQREALASLMDAWFRRLLLAEARQQGMTFMDGNQAAPQDFGDIWPKWRHEWKRGLERK